MRKLKHLKTFENHNNDDREELIDKLMSTKYASDDPKYDASNREHLNSLSEEELERELWDWEHYEGDDDEW